MAVIRVLMSNPHPMAINQKCMGQKTNSTMRRGAVDAEKSQCGCRELADLGKMTVQNEKYILDELG